MSTAIGQDEDGDQRAAEVHEEGDADQGDNEAFLQQLFFEGFDRALNQGAAVIDHRVFTSSGTPFMA